MSFLQKLGCFGSKTRSASTHPISSRETSGPLLACEACSQKLATKKALLDHKKTCQMSKANQVLPVDVSLTNLEEKNIVNLKAKNNLNTSINASRNTSVSTNANTDKSPYEPNKNNSPDRANETFLSDKNNTSMVSTGMKGTQSSFGRSVILDEVDKFANEMLNKNPKTRREAELKFITKNIEKKTDAKFLISEEWIEKYTNYLNGGTKIAPEPIDNEKLKEMVITKTLPPNIYLVNQIIWKFVQRLYGGGPEIKQHNKAITFRKTGFSEQSSDVMTADTFSRDEIMESHRNSMVDTHKNPWTDAHLQPIGFVNPSFFCYMNACLQILLGLPDFAQYLYNEKYHLVLKPDAKFWKAMTEVVHGHFKRQSCIVPKTLRRLSIKQFDPDLQHDAHEYLRFLLSYMQDEINLALPKKTVEFKTPESAWDFYKKYHVSLVDDMLAGQLISTVTCTKCRHVSTAYDPFLDLSLPIIPDKTKDINESLATFQKEEDIEDAYKCEKCKVNVKATKRLTIARCPDYLFITLKRFQTYPKKKKLKDSIHYPMHGLKIKEEVTKETGVFSLIGIIVHFGPIDSGHYISYTKRGNDWLMCDDESIKKVTENDVASNEAYVLLYEKKRDYGVPKM